MRTMLQFATLAVAGVLLAPAAVSAHRLEVEARAEGDTIRVVAWYEGDEPAEGATVTLTDAAGTVAAGGTTDAAGLCLLPRPGAGEYALVVDDGAGHRAKLMLVLSANEQEMAEARTERRNRWLMAAIGLAVIAGATAVAWRRRRAG
jgi:hypothetical protein